jgi:CheY-like chemotaxis protein
MPKHRVLIVEDEHDIAALIKHTVERGGDAEAEIVGSGGDALKAVADHPPDLTDPRSESAGPERDRGLPHPARP